MKTTKRDRSKYSRVRHPFLYKIDFPNGKMAIKKAFARVARAKKPVTIELTADHVRKSIKLDGVGNTAHCSAAVCLTQHAEAFPHPVEGYVDFQYARAFVVSKVDKHGFPCACVAYEHRCADVAKLNDTKGGQEKLLALLLDKGPIRITLLPYRKRSIEGRPGRERKPTGARSKRIQGTGANLRYATAIHFGAFPTAEK